MSTSQNLTNLISSLGTVSSSFRSEMQSASSELTNALSQARKAGASRYAAEMLNQKRLNSTMNKFQQKYLQAQASGDTLRMARLEEGFKKELKHIKTRLESHEEANKIMQDGVDDFVKKYKSGLLEGAENAAEALEAGFENLQNNLKNLDIKGFGSMLKSGGQGLQNMGGAMGGSLGPMVAQLGKVAAGLGAVVAVFGVFAAVMAEADKKAKEMNSSLLDGISVFDAGANQVDNFSHHLHTLRQQAFDIGSEFRLAGEEISQLQNAFMAAGMTMSEFEGFTGAGDSVTGLGDALRETLTMSRLLGMDAKTLAETYTKMNEDFGLDMSQISDAFRDIYTAANLSSIGTQKFTAMITQATGSMALFNVDFSETAALASEFIEALGEEGASDLLQNLSGKFGNMGYQERFKTNMLSGGGVAKGMKAGMKAGAARLESSAAGGQIADILTEMGFGGKGLAEALMDKKMGAKQQRELIDRASMSGMDDAFVRQLQTVSIQANALRTGVTKGMGALDAGGTLSVMQSIAENFGGGDMRKIGDTGMMVLEEVTGMSGKELDSYTRVIDKMRGQYEGINRQFKELESMEDPKEKAKKIKQIEEEYKVTIGESGQMINMQTGEEIKSFTEYLAGMSTPKDLEAALTKDQMLAQEAVEETRTLGAIMENTIGAILDNIYTLLTGWMSMGRDEGEAKVLTDFVSKMSDRKMNLTEQETALKTELRTNKDLTGDQKAKIEEQLGTISKQKRLVDTAMRRAPSQGVGFFDDYGDTDEEMMGYMNKLTKDVRHKEFGRKETRQYQVYETRKVGGEFEQVPTGRYREETVTVADSMEDLLKGSEKDAETLVNTLTKSEETAKNTGKDGTLEKASDRTTTAVQALLSYQESMDLATALGTDRATALKVLEEERKKKSVHGLGGSGAAEGFFDKVGADETMTPDEYNKRRDTLVGMGLISAGSYARRAPPVEDFVYQGDAFGRGTITPIHDQDALLYGKPNGPFDKAMASGGGGDVINIFVNAGDKHIAQSIASTLKSKKGSGAMGTTPYGGGVRA